LKTFLKYIAFSDDVKPDSFRGFFSLPFPPLISSHHSTFDILPASPPCSGPPFLLPDEPPGSTRFRFSPEGTPGPPCSLKTPHCLRQRASHPPRQAHPFSQAQSPPLRRPFRSVADERVPVGWFPALAENDAVPLGLLPQVPSRFL